MIITCSDPCSDLFWHYICFIRDDIQTCSDYTNNLFCYNNNLFWPLFWFVLTLLFFQDDIQIYSGSCSHFFWHFIYFVLAIIEYITLIKNTNKKSLSKYSQVGSCFEVFIVKDPMMQSEFNFDVWFVIYIFFKF
jgi:hypothetical protein